MLLASGMSSKERLWRFYERLTDDRIVAIAAGVTFYALLAIFPAIAALVAIYGLFADPAAIAKHLDDISNFIPAGAIEVIRDQLARVTSGGRGTLGFAFVIGLGISLWSANAGVKALIDALNIAYGEREKRGFFRLNAVSLAFTLGGILTVMIALGVIVVLPLALHYVGLEGAPRSIVVLAKWPLMFVAVALGIAVLCHYGPSRTEPKWHWITWGSVLATVGWIAVSILFSWYAANFGSYNKTYGSLGAVIGFMTWMWLSTIVVLLGAELDAEMEHQTSATPRRNRPSAWAGERLAETLGTRAKPRRHNLRPAQQEGDAMNASTSPGTSGSTYGIKPSDAEPDAHADPGNVDRDSLTDLKKLRSDVTTLTDTLSRLASQVGADAAKTVRSAGQSFSAQVGSVAGAAADASSDLASSAKEHANTFVSELEGMARRNPLGTIAGALLVGVIIGMMSRGRG